MVVPRSVETFVRIARHDGRGGEGEEEREVVAEVMKGSGRSETRVVESVSLVDEVVLITSEVSL
jgi:hypothetical protein